jgi:N4-(beta-N-acetylglucosaminyl)-L-asparaginase
MRHGMSPKDAITDCLKRISRNFNNDRQWLSQIGINFYALRKDGEYAGGTLWSGGSGAGRAPSFAVNDGGQTRLENCFSLLQRA